MSIFDDFEKQRKLTELKRKKDEEIQEIAKFMTLENFSSLYSSIKLSDKENEIAKAAEIVIAVYTGHAIFMKGAIEHGIDLLEEDDCFDDMWPEEIDEYLKEKEKRFRGSDFYFDKIGFFNPFSHFQSIEKWEEFLKNSNRRCLKMSYNNWEDKFDCNFTYLPFQYTSGLLENSPSIVFKKPQFAETLLNKFRIPSYQEEDDMVRASKHEIARSGEEKNYFNNWVCDACGGNQDTGCLSSTDCFRH
jgi:hypothetical protein